MYRAPDLETELVRARVETDKLFRYISPEAVYDRPITERNRLIFYLGHLEAFDWRIVAQATLGEPSFHPTFDKLFERGIDPEPGKAPSDTPNDWPGRREVETYGQRARDWIDAHINDVDPGVLQMAIEHRYMHAETFAYLMHNLRYDQKTAGPAPEFSARPAPENPTVEIPAGIAVLGKYREGFGWDNEHLAHEVQVSAFRTSRYKVSNGDYLRFVEETGASPSHFWSSVDGKWMYRGMFETVPLQLDHAAWVTWHQASAYAAWRGMRLPTEAQYQRAIAVSGKPQSPDIGNYDLKRFDPVAVDLGASPENRVHQLVGNGWEWMQDVFAPFEGFAPHPVYPLYSSDFFDNQHYVMKGASPRTASLLTRPSFRNWFRPEYPHMYAGFRLVEV